jgi:DGQHR domain-containing protein
VPSQNGHGKLRDKIASIFRASGFDTDRTVHIKTPTRETDLDVCALYQEVLIAVECKTGRSIHFDNLISELKSKRDEIIDQKDKLSILGSIDNVVTQKRLSLIKMVKVAVAFREYHPAADQIERARRSDIEVLDSDAIEYYDRTSRALGRWTKYEIFKEMCIRRQEEDEEVKVDSLRLEQPGATLYVFSLPPYRLLRIAYVHRRSSKATYAYQRIVNPNRTEKISRFLSLQRAFLPNAILLAFDEEISDRVCFEPPDATVGKLTVPMKYCSSWIVDGQHRLYGFEKTDYSVEPSEEPAPRGKFDLLVVGLKGFRTEHQAKTFVDVNDNQKRIDPTLLCDLTTLIKDLRHPLTWPSLLVEELNRRDPWKERIRIFEISRAKPITLAGFAKWALSRELLRRKEHVDGRIEYLGPLFKYAEFDYTRDMDYAFNKGALSRQASLLARYFKAVKQNLDRVNPDIWDNPREYGVTKTTGVNALLLVLNRLMEQKPELDLDLVSYLRPIAHLSFKNRWIVRFGGGWDGFKSLAKRIIRDLNKNAGFKIGYYKTKRRTGV